MSQKKSVSGFIRSRDGSYSQRPTNTIERVNIGRPITTCMTGDVYCACENRTSYHKRLGVARLFHPQNVHSILRSSLLLFHSLSSSLKSIQCG